MTHILLIDDDADVRESTEFVLNAFGFTVDTAVDGRDGLRRCGERRPDLVLTDILMPEVDGIETIRTMRKIYGDLPILAVSGGCQSSRLDLLKLVADLGATRTLRKPFRTDDLLYAIAGCLAQEPSKPASAAADEALLTR